MEKTIKWEGAEVFQVQQIEQEKTQVLAQIGALMLDLETAKKNLETVNEKFKAVVKQAIQSRGINQFDSARPMPGGVSLTIPDAAIPLKVIDGGA